MLMAAFVVQELARHPIYTQSAKAGQQKGSGSQA
jgi:hypothetical protein